MKSKLVYLTFVVVTIVTIFSFLTFTKPINASAAVAIENTTWIDNFDSETLDSRWSWVRENPTYWSLTDNPGSLRLVTRGSLHQTNNNLENILVTPVSDEDYQIITQITFSPTENYQRAGLLVYEDDDNYIQLTLVYSDRSKVRIKREIGGVTLSYTTEVTATTLYLRIDKYGDDYYGFYSIDGNVWEFVGQYNMNLSNADVGLAAANGPTTSEVDADFEYFQFIPRTFNNFWVDDFSVPTLSSAWSWLNEDPTHWSLTNSPGFLQITTQTGGIFSGAYHNLLLTEAPSEEYQITTRVTISPTETFQGASIIVYGNDDNYVRVSRRFANAGDEINFRHESNDTVLVNIGVSETATTLYLRITKEGDLYSGFYSIDGNSYSYIGQTEAVITNPKIGILSENGPSTTEIQSDYDFFKLENNINWIYLPLVIK